MLVCTLAIRSACGEACACRHFLGCDIFLPVASEVNSFFGQKPRPVLYAVQRLLYILGVAGETWLRVADCQPFVAGLVGCPGCCLE